MIAKLASPQSSPSHSWPSLRQPKICATTTIAILSITIIPWCDT
jgi:hypothetical protein